MNSPITLVQACLLGAAFLVALFYFGYGATRFLLPASLREWRSLTTPFVGLALLVVWDYLALFFGFNLTIATIALLAVVTAVNGAAVVQPLANPSPSPRGREGWGLFAVALLTFLAAIAPLVRYGSITIIGENWDYEFYLPLADALRTMPTNALAQTPSNPLMNVILSRHIIPLPMGFSYLQSSLDVLLRLDALDSFAILLAVVRALGVVSTFVFFRATLKMRPRAALAASALLGLNGLLLWATYWNFGLHLTSLALLPIALALGAGTLLASSKGPPGGGRPRGSPLQTVPIAALFLAALNVTFHPTLIAALLPLAALGLYALLAGRAPPRSRGVCGKRARTLAVGVALIILTIALSFPTLFHLGDFLREYYGREPLATGLREFIPLTDAYGFSQYSLELVVGHIIPTPALYELATRAWGITAPVLLLFVLAASASALWRLWREPSTPWRHIPRMPPTPCGTYSAPRDAPPSAGHSAQDERRAVWFIVVGASIFYIAIFRLPFLHPYPYGFLKSLTLVSFVLIGLAVEGTGVLFAGLQVKKLKVNNFISFQLSNLLTICSLAFVALTIFTFAITLEQYFKPAPPFFNADDLRLRALPRILPQGATVFLSDRREVQEIPMGLAAYVLREFPLYGQVNTGYGEMNNAVMGAMYDYALLARGEDPTGRGYQATPLWSNHKFALYAKAPSVVYHRALNVRMAAADPLTLTLGANAVVTGTQTMSPTLATRGVSLALASFVPQTATLTVSGAAQNVALVPGLTVYRISQARLPDTLTITTKVPQPFMDAAKVHAERPHELPGADVTLFVPWVELREADGGEQPLAPTSALLVRCTSVGASDLNARCFVANPGGIALRWEYVVRGTPKGTREDQELIRRAAVGSPQRSVEIGADSVSGLSRLQFDDLAPLTFPSQKLPDGNYRAALEVFSLRPRSRDPIPRPPGTWGAGPVGGTEGRDDILGARIDLYRFNIGQEGSSLKRFDTPDPPLFIVQP